MNWWHPTYHHHPMYAPVYLVLILVAIALVLTDEARRALGVIIIVGLLIFALGGCAPTSIRAEVIHDSHLSQHFGPNPTDNHSDLGGVSVHWDLQTDSLPNHGLFLELGDYWSFKPWDGRREVFEGRVGYQWNLAGPRT